MFEDELTPTRRQFPRIPAEDVVLIHRIGPAEQEEQTKVRQIGLGGLMISSVESLGVDSYLRLKLTIDAEEVEATGRVVWEKPAGPTWTRGASWSGKDMPMLLHTFEYIVRNSLLKWWDSLLPDPNEGLGTT